MVETQIDTIMTLQCLLPKYKQTPLIQNIFSQFEYAKPHI